MNIHLAHPEAFVLLLAVPVAAWALLCRGRRLRAAMPTARLAGRHGRTWRTRLGFVPVLLRAAALAMLVTALARPREVIGSSRIDTDAIAIMVVVDRSGSMREPMMFEGRAESRLDVVKRVLEQFIKGDEARGMRGREGDLIGLIAFARYADTVCPLVHAHDALLRLTQAIDVARIPSENMTAIGDAIALGAAKLRQAEDDLARRAGHGDQRRIESKVMILLTDGENNAGEKSPAEAAKLAAEWGVKIHVIGIGAGENVMVMQTPFGERRIPVGGGFNDAALREAADLTGGRYWSADDAEALRNIYAEIDKMERTVVRTETFTRYHERFMPFALAAALALALELLASSTILRRLPS